MNLTRFYTLCLGGVFAISASAQSEPAKCTSANVIDFYQELPNPAAVDPSEWSPIRAIRTGWGDTDIRYAKESPAAGLKNSKTLKGWRGEKVAAQFVVSTPDSIAGLQVIATPLIHSSDKKTTIGKDDIFTGYVRYVMTDELNKDGKGACGHRPDASAYDSSLVADVIDHRIDKLPVSPLTTQPVWVRVDIPQDMKPGIYNGTIQIKDGERLISELKLSVDVNKRSLPAPSEWSFHLDLWQNPYACARYYQVEPWSEAHFEAMRPDMQLYADAGGKVITTSIMHKPWNAQTYDYFESMVTWMKKADGTWYYDFTPFDKWVEFMMSLGVNKQIACYSLIPWHLSFQYFDQATNSLKFINTEPGKPEFEQHWGGMLKAFAAHLKQKGWFDITYISMDEREMQAMLVTIDLIKKADPDFKISMAGTLFPELEEVLDDYCVALEHKFVPEILRARKDLGKITTYYTSCAEAYPNTFTFSPPAEAAWLGWYAAKENYDGYLRWAFNSWVKSPLQDSRFYTWAAGDTYLVYPYGRTSVRYEKMIEGIQAYEKIRILRDEFKKKGDQTSLRKLQKSLEPFKPETLEKQPADKMTKNATELLNRF